MPRFLLHPTRALVISTLFSTLLLAGCQPAQQEEIISEEAHTEESHESHAVDEHDMHEHEEHDEHMREHADEHELEADAHHDHDHEHDHDHDAHRVQYNCQPEQSIGVAYHADDTPATAHLLIEGIEYDLTLDDKNNYRSEYGINENRGLIWQVDDSSQNTATLYEVPVASESASVEVAPADKTELYSCQKAS